MKLFYDTTSHLMIAFSARLHEYRVSFMMMIKYIYIVNVMMIAPNSPGRQKEGAQGKEKLHEYRVSFMMMIAIMGSKSSFRSKWSVPPKKRMP